MASELAIEVARLRGWTEIKPSPTEMGLGGDWFGNRPDGKAWGTRVPDYDTDRAAALELLEYVLSIEKDGQYFYVADLEKNTDAWYVELALDFPSGNKRFGSVGESVRLTVAIALACRDALRAVKGETP